MMQKLSQFIINHWLLVTAFMIALIILFIIEMRNKGFSGSNRLTPSQAVRLINSEKAVVIDVRDPTTFEKGHITNAVNIPVLELDRSLKRLEQYKQNPLIIVCTTGQKSAYIVNKLRKQSYQKVYMFSGGMGAWTNANMPVIK